MRIYAEITKKVTFLKNNFKHFLFSIFWGDKKHNYFDNIGVKPANTVIDAQWVKFTKGTARATMIFNPTIFHMLSAITVTENSSNQSLMAKNSESIERVEMVRTFLKGVEGDSVSSILLD